MDRLEPYRIICSVSFLKYNNMGHGVGIIGTIARVVQLGQRIRLHRRSNRLHSILYYIIYLIFTAVLLYCD